MASSGRSSTSRPVSRARFRVSASSWSAAEPAASAATRAIGAAGSPGAWGSEMFRARNVGESRDPGQGGEAAAGHQAVSLSVAGAAASACFSSRRQEASSRRLKAA